MDVRRARPQDREAIFSLYKTAYGDWEQRIPERWLWQFVTNPFADPENLAILLAVDDDDQIIGQTCSIMEPVRVEGENYLMGWVVDVFVRAEYRGQGVAKALKKVQKAQKELIEMSISMVDTMRHIVQNLGSKPLAPLEIYLLRVNPIAVSDALARRIGGGFFAFLLSKSRLAELYGYILNARLNRSARVRQQWLGNDVRFTPIEEWGDDADALWASLEGEIPNGAIRTARYLNWKYNAQPGITYECFMAYRDDIPTGYVILRNQKSRGVVVDLLFSPADRKGILAALDFAVAHFAKLGIAEVRAGAAHPALTACMRSVGYPKPVHTMTPLFYTTRDLNVERITTTPWWITLGDHDIQQ